MYQNHYELMKLILAWTGTILLIGIMILFVITIIYCIITEDGRRIHKELTGVVKEVVEVTIKEGMK